ncbi:GNAT family N-acetyltransferase [Polaribacter ponticola]|uniref:GNAT family N-acetyltransferase n=1 Tax=Polaribacter ponticola TaxID=2978475 RepID=A0ABT5S937_9FLAO|nr:GNAT family N-acetyltransferase [Polaribacter sp. MSW5]MDD7914615.1 GNAT family N-acetyltransferase [Polaribacter sp. MSW5]
MHTIRKATITDAKKLAEIAKASFLVAHGHSAPKKDIDNYVAKNFKELNFQQELENPKNLYFLIYSDDKIAGYSKLILNSANENVADKNIAQMSRLYLLEEFYGLSLGKELFNFNVAFSKQNNQKGIWLAVWIENQRAIKFYTKMGIKKVGSFDYEISEANSNPNHILFLEF